jgi:hypothetical protein
MFIFTGNKPMIDKVINAEYESDSIIQALEMYTFSYSWVLKMCISLKIFKYNFLSLHYFFVLYAKFNNS